MEIILTYLYIDDVKIKEVIKKMSMNTIDTTTRSHYENPSERPYRLELVHLGMKRGRA